MLDITDGARSFRLTYNDRVYLEKALNRSPYGASWGHITDFLFDINVWKTLEMTLRVTREQYDVLFMLSHD